LLFVDRIDKIFRIKKLIEYHPENPVNPVKKISPEGEDFRPIVETIKNKGDAGDKVTSSPPASPHSNSSLLHS